MTESFSFLFLGLTTENICGHTWPSAHFMGRKRERDQEIDQLSGHLTSELRFG